MKLEESIKIFLRSVNRRKINTFLLQTEFLLNRKYKNFALGCEVQILVKRINNEDLTLNDYICSLIKKGLSKKLTLIEELEFELTPESIIIYVDFITNYKPPKSLINYEFTTGQKQDEYLVEYYERNYGH